MLLTSACCPKLSSNPNSTSQPRPRASSSSERSISSSHGHSGQRSGRPTARASSPGQQRVTYLRHVADWVSSTSRPKSHRYKPSLAGSSSTTPITPGQISFPMRSPLCRVIVVRPAEPAEQQPEQQQQPSAEFKPQSYLVCHLVHTGLSPALMPGELVSTPSSRHPLSHQSRPS